MKVGMRVGVTVFAIGSAVAGVLDLIWGEFEPAHQPVQAWGDHIFGAAVFACVAALWLILGGLALLRRSSMRLGAALLTVLYGIFVAFPLPRLFTAPHYLGYRLSVYIGVVSNICQQVILLVAAAVLWGELSRAPLSRPAARLARCAFGLSSLAFGIGNLAAIETVTPLIPRWIPLGTTFWAVLTGIAFALAGLAIIPGVLDVLAGGLLGAMLVVFSVFALMPLIWAAPRDHVAWGGNAYNLTAVGAAWVIAGWLADRRESACHRHGTRVDTLSPV